MQTKSSSGKSILGRKDESPKKNYRKPDLQTYGKVKNLTHSSGTKNGDGGQNMML